MENTVERIRLREVLALYRACPHHGCGTPFRIPLDRPVPFVPDEKQFCESCKELIAWPELKRINEWIAIVREMQRQNEYGLIVVRATESGQP